MGECSTAHGLNVRAWSMESSPYLEALFALRIAVLDFYIPDVSLRASRVTPLDHRLDSVLRSLEHGFNAAIIEVFNPAIDIPLSRFVLGR
jgi:hypothetical protein